MEQKTLWNSFYKLVGGEVQLKTLQQVVTYLLQLVDRPTISSKDIAQFIMTDPPLSAKVLTVVNSPAIGLRHHVSDLPLAISLLGLNQIRDIILNIAIIEKSSTESQVTRIWRHSFLCGKIAEILARNLGKSEGETFAAGLLHDIGKIIMCYSNSMAFSTALHNYKYQKGKIQHWESEKITIGMNHAQVGGLAAVYWKFPEILHRAIWNHHSPPQDFPKTDEESLTQIVYVADLLCWSLGYPSVDSPNPYLDHKKPLSCLPENFLKFLAISQESSAEFLMKAKLALRQSETIFEAMQVKK